MKNPWDTSHLMAKFTTSPWKESFGEGISTRPAKYYI